LELGLGQDDFLGAHRFNIHVDHNRKLHQSGIGGIVERSVQSSETCGEYFQPYVAFTGATPRFICHDNNY
jgi:hypothetical protein